MDNQKIREACIKEKEEKLRKLEESFEATKQYAADAPGSSQSHSDTSKFQHSNLALGTEMRIQEAKEELRMLQALPGSSKEKVFVGACFVLRDLNSGQADNYFLIPKGGGDFLEVDGEEIMVISEESPIAEAVMGKRKGEVISFREKKLMIQEIQ